MKKLLIILNTFLLALFLTACSDINSSSGTETNTDKPELRNFLANIDTGTATAQSLGKVEIVSAGGSSISSYRLEGNGFSNFDISSSGEISTRSDTNLDCTTYKNYDLDVIATNRYGDSNKAQALIQVNCLDEPVLQAYKLNLQYQSGDVGTMTFVRTDINSTDTINIQEIQLVDAPSGVSVSTDGTINISEFLPLSRYDIKVRAINTNSKTGPYVYLTIYTANSGGTDGSTSGDDFFDYIDSSTYTAAYIGIDGGYYNVYGFMNFVSDHDYIKIYVENDGTQLSFNLYTDGNYNYGNGGNYIALYDEYGTYYETYSDSYPSTTLNAGYYYVNVHETSDSYTLEIYANTGASSDTVGGDIGTSTFIGSVDSYTNPYLNYNSNIDTYGDRDVFGFYVNEAGNYSIGTSYADFDTYGRLYDSNGIWMNENDNNIDSNFMISATLSPGTYYYIEVSGAYDSYIGNYDLYIQYVSP